MKKNLLTLLLIFCSFSAWSGDAYVEIGSGSSTTSNSPFSTANRYSLSQQMYTKSELNGSGLPTAEGITAISFYYAVNGKSTTRELEIYFQNCSYGSFGSNFENASSSTKVYDGDVTLPSSAGWYRIELDTKTFTWNGTSTSLLVTIVDKTGTSLSGVSHGCYTGSYRNMYSSSWASLSKPTSTSVSGTKTSDVPQIRFHYNVAESAPSTPSDLAVIETTESSASLSWTAVSGATSYDLEYYNGSAWVELVSGRTTTSYEWTGLSANTSYQVKIRANNAGGSSDWSDAVSFTTDALHEHDEITFSKWTKSDEMPLSGNYYLANDVSVSAMTAKTTSGDLNLCLNGHSITFGPYTYLTVSDGHSMALYDNVGGGLITGSHGSYTILVDGPSGSLAVHGGNVANSGEGKAISADGAVSIDLTESASNDSYLAIAEGNLNVSVNMTRSFTLSQYNTICLPFTLYNTELQNVFGSGYDLEEFTGSNLNGDELVLNFTKVTTLEAGEPYLIKPAHDVVNPTFANVGINSNLYPKVDDANISFIGTYSPTALQSDPNILFLGANNELFWPQAAGNIGGFRAYFMLKGNAQAATRARIVKQEDDAKGVENVSANTGGSEKLMRNGELLIIRDGKTYNALGQIVK